jgi:hypothetical protein
LLGFVHATNLRLHMTPAEYAEAGNNAGQAAGEICLDEERRRLALVGHMPTPPAVSDKKSTARFRAACSRGSK